MTIDEIREAITKDGRDLNNYLFIPIKNGWSIWMKEYAPSYVKEAHKIKEHDVRIVKAISQQATKRLVLEGVLLTEELDTLVDIYDDWKPDIPYETDDLFTHNGKFYKVLQPHKSQTDWIPGVGTESLYTPIGAPGEIEEWGTRNLTTNPFMIGEQVKYTDGVIYESTINNNVWTPVDYPQGWKVV